jgi:hypothetical protein
MRDAHSALCLPVRAVMQIADTNDPGYEYLNIFNTNTGLPPAGTGRQVW